MYVCMYVCMYVNTTGAGSQSSIAHSFKLSLPKLTKLLYKFADIKGANGHLIYSNFTNHIVVKI